jgi:hypothetical protein
MEWVVITALAVLVVTLLLVVWESARPHGKREDKK